MIICSKLHQPLHLQIGQPRSLVRSPCTQVLLQSINGRHSLHLQISQPTLFSRNPWLQFFWQPTRAGQAVGPTCNAKHSHNLFPWLSCKYPFGHSSTHSSGTNKKIVLLEKVDVKLKSHYTTDRWQNVLFMMLTVADYMNKTWVRSIGRMITGPKQSTPKKNLP